MRSEPGNELDRRRFLSTGLWRVSASWIAVHWPAVMAAAEHAAHARQAVAPPKPEVLTADQAAEVDAVASRIIPSDDSPGAHEAGAIYFIDRALATFASGSRDDYQQGLRALEAKTREIFSHLEKFSQAAPDQQDIVLKAMEAQPFFELIRTHTIMGFLADPMRSGNHDEIGWKLIGFDSSPDFAPPFGYYDRDYPGWQPPTREKGNT